MCIVLSGGKVGMAYYQVETAFLYVMVDVAEAEDLGLLRRGQLPYVVLLYIFLW